MADEIKQRISAVCNAVSEFESRLKQGNCNPEALFDNWVAKPIDSAIFGAFVGAVSGFSFDLLVKAAGSVFSFQLPLSPDPEVLAGFGVYQPLVQSMMVGSGLWARNLAVRCGVGSGISCAMKNLRGKEDVQTRLVADFGSGFALALVTGLRGPEAIFVGVMHALMKGGLLKAYEKLSKVKAEDVPNDKTRDMFSSIGIDHHALNVNTCFFTGNALSLPTDHRKEAKKGGKRTWFC